MQSMRKFFTHWGTRPWERLRERGDHTDFEALIREEKSIMKACSHLIEWHRLPAVLVGFGSASFGHKLATLMHGCRLEHWTHSSLSSWVSEVVTNMNDYGTEKAISRLYPIKVSTVCPHFKCTSEADVALMMA